MLEYTKKGPSIEIRVAGDYVLRDTAQGILLVVVCGSDYFLTVKLPIVLMPGLLKRNLFSSLVAAQKGVKTVIENNGSSIDLGPFSVQLIRFDNDMDYLDLTIAKESRKTQSLPFV